MVAADCVTEEGMDRQRTLVYSLHEGSDEEGTAQEDSGSNAARRLSYMFEHNTYMKAGSGVRPVLGGRPVPPALSDLEHTATEEVPSQQATPGENEALFTEFDPEEVQRACGQPLSPCPSSASAASSGSLADASACSSRSRPSPNTPEVAAEPECPPKCQASVVEASSTSSNAPLAEPPPKLAPEPHVPAVSSAVPVAAAPKAAEKEGQPAVERAAQVPRILIDPPTKDEPAVAAPLSPRTNSGSLSPPRRMCGRPRQPLGSIPEDASSRSRRAFSAPRRPIPRNEPVGQASEGEAEEAAPGQDSFAPPRARFSGTSCGVGELTARVASLRHELQQEQQCRLRLELENVDLGKKLRNAKSIIKRLLRELEKHVDHKDSTVSALFALAAVSDTESDEVDLAMAQIRPSHSGSSGSRMSLLEVGTSAFSGLSGAIGQFFFSFRSSKVQAWCEDPLSDNLELGDDCRTIRFTGGEEEMCAFACTAEPPYLTDGYGFEVEVLSLCGRGPDEMAIGFTFAPPDEWPEELPETADCLEDTWLVGYNEEMWSCEAGWVKVSFRLPELLEGDRVGVVATFSGRFQVFVNGRCSWTTDISLQRGDPPLYGIVDLVGAVSEVALVSRQGVT